MFPILFRLGPINIYSYGTMVALAFIVCLFLLKNESRRCGISYQVIVDFCFWVLVWGIIGARILYVVLNLDYFRTYPQEIFKLYHGGLVLYGGDEPVAFGKNMHARPLNALWRMLATTSPQIRF